MTEPTPNTPEPSPAEYDFTRFPDKVTCMAMPSLDGVTADIQISESLGDKINIQVPDNIVMRINLGNFARAVKKVDPEMAESIEKDFGLSIARCRIVEQQGDLTRIVLPTLKGEIELIVKTQTIAKPQ
jgi:hypothetical protein